MVKNTKPIDTSRSLQLEIEAARVLKEQLADIAAGDPEFMRDMIEGETSLHERISALLASIGEDEALVEGITRQADNLKARKERIKARAEIKRALIATALDIGEIKRLEAPSGTVTAKSTAPTAIIVEESEIPSRFFKPQPPKLALKELTDALKARDAAIAEATSVEDETQRAAALASVNDNHPAIPGATLSNGGRTIQITWR